MFGLATKKDWNKWIGEANGEFNKAIAARFQALREEMLERLEELEPKVEQPQAPEHVETHGNLWRITISRNDEPHPERYTWEDCTGYNHERYFDGAISGINIRFKNGATAYKAGRWNVEMTEQKAEPKLTRGESIIKPAGIASSGKSLLQYLADIESAPCTNGDASRIKDHLEKKIAKAHDELMHKIELLELRLNGADKQAKAQPTKGAKR